MGQESPLASGTQDIKDGINNLSTQMINRTPSVFNCRNQWFDELPFFISQIRWVIQSVVHTTILPILPTFKTTSEIYESALERPFDWGSLY